MSALETAALVNGLLRYEAAWYAGYSMAQTIHTCLYLHQDAFDALWEFIHVPVASESGTLYEGRDLKTPVTADDTRKHTLALVLCAYVLCLMKTCSAARDDIMRADIYEVLQFAWGEGQACINKIQMI